MVDLYTVQWMMLKPLQREAVRCRNALERTHGLLEENDWQDSVHTVPVPT